MASVTMPQLGETVVEGTILKWLKSEGEQVEQDEPLFEISTDKVDTEVPSPEAGVLTKILVPEGETVAVGTELAQIEADGQAASSPAPEAATTDAEGAPSGTPEAATRTGETATAEPTTTEAQDMAASSGAPPAAAPAASSGAPPVAPSRPVAAAPGDRGARSQILSPLVRKLADEHQVDLSRVSGTGTGGRITKNDVLAFVESGKGAAAPVAASGAPARAAAASGEEIVPVSHIRKAIATHMLASLQTSARAWNMVEVDMENVARLRTRAKEAFKQREGFNLTYMPFVTRATTEALLAYPRVNSELRGEEIVVRHFVNMGIAVSIDDGLIVPVVMGCDSMNLVGIARAINDLATRARAKQLKPDEVHGGTFSITNPGPFGSVLSVPIINQPQTGILAFDSVQKRAVVVDDAIAIRHMVYLSMSWDHRVIDGALASQFLARIKQNLETWDFAEDLGI